MSKPYPVLVTELLDAWTSRAKAQYLKPGTVKYLTRRMEFFLGASTCNHFLTGNPQWPLLMLLAVGRPTKGLYPTLAAPSTVPA